MTLVDKEKVVKAATVNIRIDSQTKKEVEGILNIMGLSTAEAVRMFFALILLYKGLPFSVKIPNKETLMAMDDADQRKTEKAESLNDIFKDFD